MNHPLQHAGLSRRTTGMDSNHDLQVGPFIRTKTSGSRHGFGMRFTAHRVLVVTKSATERLSLR
jgi:hypothetical protein